MGACCAQRPPTEPNADELCSETPLPWQKLGMATAVASMFFSLDFLSRLRAPGAQAAFPHERQTIAHEREENGYPQQSHVRSDLGLYFVWLFVRRCV